MNFFRILKTSVLCSELERVRPVPWHTTTCQDIVHSIYCTHLDFKNAVIDSQEKLALDTASIMIMITTLLRPFCLSWHSIFFENIGSDGEKNMKTIPIDKVPEKTREIFRENFFELRNAVNTYCDNYDRDEYLAAVIERGEIFIPDQKKTVKEQDNG